MGSDWGLEQYLLELLVCDVVLKIDLEVVFTLRVLLELQ